MARILVVDNEERMCKLLKSSLELESYEVEISFSGSGAKELLDQYSFDILITDLKMQPIDGIAVLEYALTKDPGIEVILMTAYASQETALTAMKMGAYDYLIKPFNMDELSLRIDRILKQKALEEENRKLKKMSSLPEAFPGIVGKSEKMRHVFKLIEQVSDSDATVLIRGESGTGKELVAQAIHRRSPRRNHTFVAINCAALPETLLESELFGYEKGAFTGASQRKPGQFELADKGTLFLDEIGDLSLALQGKLLRVLQSNQITHLGGQEPINVDVRLLAATHRNLETMIDEQTFRSDLFYRINIFPLQLPPLRERKEDIPELLQHFLARYPEKSMTAEVKRLLMEYNYPGNVRELENIIARATIIADTVIDDIDLPSLTSSNDKRVSRWEEIPDNGINLDDLEKKLIRKALEKAEGNKSRAAQLLGITRRRLYSMMERFAIS